LRRHRRRSARAHAGMPSGVRGAIMAVKVSVLGFAHGHVGVYCDQWKTSADVKVVAGWDHDRSRAENAKAKYQVEIFATPQAAIERADAVLIGAETSLHADLVEAAAAAQKKIILQKPLALTMDEGDRIVAAVEREEVPFTLAWQM